MNTPSKPPEIDSPVVTDPNVHIISELWTQNAQTNKHEKPPVLLSTTHVATAIAYTSLTTFVGART